jgi:[acyl-carrier-protein] S-malonyltransferase
MSFALLCPGQGAQTPGFLRVTLESDPDIAAALEAATGLCATDINTLSAEALRANAIAQPCLMAWQLWAWRQLAPQLPRPALAMGYSLGEVVALACAAGCQPGAAIALAKERALAMDNAFARPCAMLALRGLSAHHIAALCAPLGWHMAIRNGEDRFVVAGEAGSAAAMEAAALAAGASVTAVSVTTPSHTPLLAAAVAPFAAALAREMPERLAFPVISALDARLVHHNAQARERLARQLSEPLDWAGALDCLAERGITLCLELGPGMDLSRMLRERHPHIAARSVSEFDTLGAVIAWMRQRLS